MLNRVIRWTPEGITYEADQRHAELIVQDLGLTGAKSVTTPGSKDDNEKARVGNDDGQWLDAKEASRFRGLSARLNFLAQDRPDLMYASKEISRRMAKPGEGDWGLLKRVGRYLLKVPRLGSSSGGRRCQAKSTRMSIQTGLGASRRASPRQVGQSRWAST